MIAQARLWLLVRHELRSIIRDRKTVFFSVLLPFLMLPMFLVGSRWAQDQRQSVERQRTHHYAVVGEDAPWIQAEVERGLAALKGAQPQKIELEEVEDAHQALNDEDIAAYLTTAHVELDDDTGRQITVHFRGNREASAGAASALKEILEAARAQARTELLAARGPIVPSDALASTEEHDIASKGQVAGSALGQFLIAGLVFLIMAGGQVVSADIMAGEKERGTLETLITTAATRQEIVVSKLITIATVALAITGINILNLLVYVSFGLIAGLEDLGASLPPMAVTTIAVLFVPVALLLSSVLLLVSGRARSFKEAQLFAFPVQLLVVTPALASLLPGIELRSAIVLVPIANVAVATREILVGQFNWLWLAAVALVNVAAAGVMARFSAAALREEQLVSSGGSDALEMEGGSGAFRRHVLRWAAVVWALILLTSINAPTADVRLQAFINLVVLMLGSSVVILRRYRLDIRKVWALRGPSLVVWPMVVIGAPAGFVAIQGLFVLTSFVIPIPTAELEQFSQMLLPDAVPDWQLYLMLTVTPAVCEEIFFRGTILHGLRKSFHPVTLCLVVGLIFGIFHVALFRIIPTGALGALLAGLTLVTGSIFPAMLWHALHNLTGVLASRVELPLDHMPWYVYLGSVAIVVVVALVLWRYRTPYPDLRSRRPRP